ncbi:hypothetical protein ACTJNK_29200 [Achromobacter anxifer]
MSLTDHTTAAQAAKQETVLTPEERAAAIAHLTDRDTFTARDIAIERAVLSKLRAPVADERAAFEIHQRGTGLNELYLERHAVSGQYMWTATKEAWDTWQARAAMASAPVAGEAQPVAWANEDGDPISDALKQARPDLYGKHYTRPLVYAAPQAGEAVRDADDAARWRWATASDGNADKLCSIVLCHGGYQDKINERADFYRAALSAQPGAQKGCNCATCRPHSVEMRMILCEVCGDKRCPHAADHRNECTGTGAQKEGDSNG